MIMWLQCIIVYTIFPTTGYSSHVPKLNDTICSIQVSQIINCVAMYGTAMLHTMKNSLSLNRFTLYLRYICICFVVTGMLRQPDEDYGIVCRYLYWYYDHTIYTQITGSLPYHWKQAGAWGYVTMATVEPHLKNILSGKFASTIWGPSACQEWLSLKCSLKEAPLYWP